MRPLRIVFLAALFVVIAARAVAAALPSSPPAATGAPPVAQPADPGSVLDAARSQVAAGDSAGAIAALVPYVAAHPADLAAGRLLGDLYYRVPDFAAAERTWNAILAGAPADRETHNRLGALYAAEDRDDLAIGEFRKSLPLRAAYEGLVEVHKRRGDLNVYLAKLEYATQDTPFEPNPWRDLGAALHALHQDNGALDAYRHLSQLRPRSCDYRVDLANVLVDMGRLDDAIGQLEACRVHDPDDYAATTNLGEAYLEKGEAGVARALLDHALALRPSGSEALVDVGYIYDLRGDWKTAAAYYTRAMNADPLRAEAYVDLGFDFRQQGLYNLAEAAFLKGLSVSDDGRLHYLLAVTYTEQGKIALARAQFRRALASDEPQIVHASESGLAVLPHAP